MQLAITWFELLLFQEQWVVEEGECVEDVEVVLLGQDQCIVDKQLEAFLQSVLCVFGLQLLTGECGFGGIVVQIGGADGLFLGRSKDGGLGESVNDERKVEKNLDSPRGDSKK